jgi:hypothetical protein
MSKLISAPADDVKKEALLEAYTGIGAKTTKKGMGDIDMVITSYTTETAVCIE